MTNAWRAGALLALLLLAALPSAAQQKPKLPAGTDDAIAVGEASRIQNLVSASLDERQLAAKDAVYASELIRAGQQSLGEIVLNDASKLLVGENSEISLDDFVVAETGFQTATLNLVKGSFRFISGKSAKGAFRVKTPLSSIGVRGTVFDVYVGEAGVTDVVLLQGQVRVCTLANACIVAERACDIVRVDASGSVARQPFLRSARRGRAEERSRYGLTADQGRFDRSFRAPVASCNARAAVEALDLPQGGTNSGPGGQAAPDTKDTKGEKGGGGQDGSGRGANN